MSERVRMNATTREAFVILYAVSMALRHVEQHLEPLSKRVKYGWRNIRLAEALLDKLVEQLMDTIPEEQLRTIYHQMQVTTFKLASRSVGKEDGGFWVVDKDTLTTLVKYAVDNTCILCDGKQKCELRSILDDMPVSIENESMMACKGGGLKGV